MNNVVGPNFKVDWLSHQAGSIVGIESERGGKRTSNIIYLIYSDRLTPFSS